MRVAEVRQETSDVRTLTMGFVEPDDAKAFPGWGPGQFGEFTVFGSGESVFAISNAPWRPNGQGGPAPVIECTFRDVGKVTHALRGGAVGSLIGFRGPYGNAFPIDSWRGKKLVFIGGGMGMAAIRSAILDVIDRRAEFGEILILNGARTVSDMVYKEHMREWASHQGVRVVRTVDPGGEAPGWDGEIGLIPQVFEGLGLRPDGSVVVACGPPIMLHFLFKSLEKMQFAPEQVITTLENKMKCGIGICGRCNVGPFYVCRDGPVLTWAQLKTLPADF
ncbi:MAG: heterodisulfide reductase subunit F [Acidobacteria bacterium RBG_16_68_9]|nr:MAG: heterodisulfide reductase subunit F [Acidobacteria bacterium RBG_16_68_9]